jgi:hypothetical protein
LTADAWEYAEASDRALGENPAAFSDRVADLAKDPAGAVFLRKDQQRLEMWWNARLAVITHAVSDEKGCEWAVTELSLDRSDSIAKSDLLWWTCSCCGVDLARFLPAMHIRREVAVEIFKHILSSAAAPMWCGGPIVWMEQGIE